MRIGVERVVEAGPRRVWAVLTDPWSIPEWKPWIAEIETSDRSLHEGATGRVKTRIGLWTTFEVTEYEEGEYWEWNVSRMGAVGHRVERESGVGTRVTFEIPVFAAAYAPVCRRSLRNVEELLAGTS
jgi:uncharacterized protein YndB with AHSA1/START domain